MDTESPRLHRSTLGLLAPSRRPTDIILTTLQDLCLPTARGQQYLHTEAPTRRPATVFDATVTSLDHPGYQTPRTSSASVHLQDTARWPASNRARRAEPAAKHLQSRTREYPTVMNRQQRQSSPPRPPMLPPISELLRNPTQPRPAIAAPHTPAPPRFPEAATQIAEPEHPSSSRSRTMPIFATSPTPNKKNPFISSIPIAPERDSAGDEEYEEEEFEGQLSHFAAKTPLVPSRTSAFSSFDLRRPPPPQLHPARGALIPPAAGHHYTTHSTTSFSLSGMLPTDPRPPRIPQMSGVARAPEPQFVLWDHHLHQHHREGWRISTPPMVAEEQEALHRNNAEEEDDGDDVQDDDTKAGSLLRSEVEPRNLGAERGQTKRKRATSEQLELLEKAFQDDPLPSKRTKERLAAETGLPLKRIQIWFQNRRAKQKKSNDGGASPPPAKRRRSASPGDSP